MHARLAFLMSAAPTAPRQAQETRAGSRWKNCYALLLVFGVLSGCDEPRDPPPSLSFVGLPVSGSLADALHAGFSACIEYDGNMRCRRNGVTLEGKGPYNAAVDLVGSGGRGGFDQLMLWHDKDQDAVLALVDELRRQGWLECLGGGRSGDQAIYTHQDSPVFVSLDISYWSKRRLRLIPTWNKLESRCAGRS